MKKHKIAVALVCVVFFTGARGAIAATDEEQIASIPVEWYLPEGYFPEWYEAGHDIYEPWLCTPTPPYWLTDEGRAQLRLLGPVSNEPGVGVPEPGTLVLLISGGLGVLVWGWRRRSRR